MLLDKKNAKSPHNVLFYQSDGVRQAKWKLVRTQKSDELYNLDLDLGEQNNIAEDFPDRLKELKALLDNHTKNLGKNMRLAGFTNNPRPIIKTIGKLPNLVNYLGLQDVKWSGSYKPIMSDGHP